MRFTLVDQIVSLEPGARITTLKALSLAEEYLADHFPRFPVMPGVLMLEAMTQTGAWLLRATDDYSHSLITLKQARNVRFRNFVAPGQVLTVTAQLLKHGDEESQLEVEGQLAGNLAVSGRITLLRANLSDRSPAMSETDEYIKQHLRNLFDVLYRPATLDSMDHDGVASAASFHA